MVPGKRETAKRTLVLLTLDEAQGLSVLLPTLQRRLPDELLAVDGGSTDGTRELLQSAGIRVIDQRRPGRGEAFREAMAASSGDHVVFFSPDGNEDPDDIPRLFEALETGHDLAIASRFLPGASNEEDGRLLPLRKWANQAFTRMANLSWNRGPYVTDTINGFRGVTRPAFAALELKSSGFTIEYEMTIRAFKRGMRIAELSTREGQRIGGTTKAPSLRIGLAFVRLFLAELLATGR